MQSSLGWTLLAIVGVVLAAALFLVFGFLAIFLAAPVIAVYEDVEEHLRPRATPERKPTPLGRPLLKH